jgi:hypothetical protein
VTTAAGSGAASYSTGGGGVVLEHHYGATLLSCLLTGRPGPELGDNADLVAVRFQAVSPVDDLMLTGRMPDGSERLVSIGVERGLDELREASTRVGRKDWLTMLNGAMFSLTVNDLVPQHVVQGAFQMLISGVGHIFGVGGPPPVITA